MGRRAREPEGRVAPEEPGDAEDVGALVTVRVASTEFEAQTIAAVLRDGGVDAAVFGVAIGAFGLSGTSGRLLGGVPVQVRAVDLDRAKGVLRANAFLADSVDWDSVDVGEEDGAARQLGTPSAWTRGGRWMVTLGRILAIAALLLGALALTGLWL